VAGVRKVYLAGPSIFRADAARIGQELVELCSRHGLVGLYPMEGDIAEVTTMNTDVVFESNLRLIAQADGVVADMSPFRGPHVDDGTAFEVGYAYALGKPVFAYSDSLAALIDRIPTDRASGLPRDERGYVVEDYGQPVNLMLAAAVSGLFGSPEDAIRAAAAHLLSR
jgi:nucleoside 2-deoxyribosyltransferase